MPNGDFEPMYSTNNIWYDTYTAQCLTNHLEDMEADIDTLQTGKANVNHTHNEYSPINHEHSEYALVNHSHTGYALIGHTHSYNDLEDKPVIPTTLPANGGNSHSEGCSTTASGECSHAEGYHTTASGKNAHAEGISTKATGDYTHAEGYYSEATKNYAHAEGCQTVASGTSSHAEGANTIASGYHSHAEGDETIAQTLSQHVEGAYNIPDSGGSVSRYGKYLHIAGNGSNLARSNAYTLDWDGNGWFAGTIEGTAMILKSSTPNSTKRFKITVDDSGAISTTEIN